MRHSVLTILVATFFLISCSSSSDGILGTPSSEADWAGGAATVMEEALSDPTGDFELGSQGAPPYSEPVAYSPIDVTRVVFGMVDNYLYMQLDFNGIIPSGPQGLPASGEVEQQYVTAQNFSLALDTDNSDATGGSGGGVDGVDLCFGVETDYGEGLQVNAAYGISSGPVGSCTGQLQGELGAGGPGSNFVLVRFDVSGLSATDLPRGNVVEVGGWSVAESDLYDRLTTDTLLTRSWSVPATVGGVGGGSAHYSAIQPR